MHPPVSLAGRLTGLMLLCGHVPLHAQEWKASAISSVMHYRAAVLGDTTAKFDGCQVGKHLGTSAPLPLLAVPVQQMLEPCEAAANRYTVRVDSLARRQGSDVMVYLTVIRGEWIHREDYALMTDSTGAPRGVREVRLWGAGQAYPRYPRRGNREE